MLELGRRIFFEPARTLKLKSSTATVFLPFFVPAFPLFIFAE